MQIEVSYETVGQPWGRISIKDATAAADCLSGAAFKVWTLLALNQHGYRWTGDLEPHIIRELGDYGYLIPLDDDSMIFDPSGDGERVSVPVQWQAIADLYGAGASDYNAVLDKLESLCLIDEAESILTYWLEVYADVQRSVDHSKAKNPLRFDLSVVLAWWCREHFTLEVGDVIEVGRQGEKLIFHDDECKVKVMGAIEEHKVDRFTIYENNLAFWQKAIRAGKIELRLSEVGKILLHRDKV